MLLQGEYTIVVTGDSATVPQTFENQHTNVYSDLLRAELPQNGILGMVCNKGVPGYITSEAQARFQQDVLAESPDVVIMQFGISDSMVYVWADPPVKEPRVSLDSYIGNLRKMVHALKACRCQVVMMTPNPLCWTADLRQRFGRSPYLPESPMGLNVLLKDYAQGVRELAEWEKVDLVDIYELFLAYGRQKGTNFQELLLEGMHPSAQGHRLIADAVKATLLPEPYPLGLLAPAPLADLIRRRETSC